MSQLKAFLIITLVLAGGYLLYLSASDHNTVQTYSQAPQPLPSITFMDILNADDLKAGVEQAVKQDDHAALIEWQNKAVEVAVAVELPAEDIEFLSSEKGLDFMRFRAKRSLFYQQFEQHYYNLQDIEDLKQAYPEARGLFAQADDMIAKRDAAINDIAVEMAGDGGDYQLYLEDARQLWRQRAEQGSQTLTEPAL